MVGYLLLQARGHTSHLGNIVGIKNAKQSQDRSHLVAHMYLRCAMGKNEETQNRVCAKRLRTTSLELCLAVLLAA